MIVRVNLVFIILLLLACTPKGTSLDHESAKANRPNVLFIAIDDLRPELGCYGSEIAVTPNIDKLASQGLLFNRAYCQQAICSPSRASLMTGARPETTQIIENYTYFRDVNPNIVTLPQHFKNNGYETTYSGKIFHKRAFADHPLSWSREQAEIDYVPANWPGGYALKENQELFKKNQAAIKKKYGENATSHYALGRGPAFEKADIEDHEYLDGYNTVKAIATMKEMTADQSKPFFLGLGMKLPHLDWKAPKKYWDLYDPSDISITDQSDSPTDGAAMGLHASFELRVRGGIPKTGPIEGDLATTLMHAYLASVSYVDAQIGKMIDALEEEGARDNTIIILWSDHGWHLGDMGIWGKATNYEIATRVPMIIWTPDMDTQVRGQKTDALVELVDMYPTLSELAGLDLPDHLEGQSFVPLLRDPAIDWKAAAFSQYPNPALREWAANPLTSSMRETYFGPLIEDVESKIKKQQGQKWDRDLFENDLMGYTMRTDRYRLVLWKNTKEPEADPLYIELYDHKTDPKETKNIAQANTSLANQLVSQWDKGWEGNQAHPKQ